MGKYIGNDILYGQFDKQILPVPNPPIDEYYLNHLVSSATSIQVVCERSVLEPNVDYTVRTENGRSILKLNNFIPSEIIEDGRVSLYVIFLGQKLLVPSSDLQNSELLAAIEQKADQTYVDSRIDSLLDGAPSALNTLNELSNALGADANFAGTVASQLGQIQQSISNLSVVATSGSYLDLTNKPTLESFTTLTSPTNNQVLQYDGTKWVNATLSVGATDLDGLSDVVITSAAKGHFISHNGTNFVNTRILESDAENTIPLTIKGAASQTENLFEIHNGLGTAIFSIDKDGSVASGILPVARVSGLAEVATAGTLISLTDTTITSPTNNQVLQYDGSNWVNATPSPGVTNLDGLSDVTLSSLESEQFLKYNGSEWVNSALPVADGVVPGIINNHFQVLSGTKRFQGEINTGIIDSNYTPTLNLYGSTGGTTKGARITLTGNVNDGNIIFGTKNSIYGDTITRAEISSLGLFSMYYGIFIWSGAATNKGIVVQGAASQIANLFEAQNSSGTTLTSIAADGTVHAKRYTESIANNFTTLLPVSAGSVEINASGGSVVVGALSSSVTTWDITNVPTENSKVTTITVIISGNPLYTYGDACSVNGIAVSGGVMWSGGFAPISSSGTDMITFIIAKDGSGAIKVLATSTTNFS